jgi:hypothetical protein
MLFRGWSRVHNECRDDAKNIFPKSEMQIPRVCRLWGKPWALGTRQAVGKGRRRSIETAPQSCRPATHNQGTYPVERHGKPMHGKRIAPSLCLYPGQTSAGISSGLYVQQSWSFSALTMQLNPGNGLKQTSVIPGIECGATAPLRLC